MALNIPIILGTARKGRQSEKVANYMLEQAKAAGITTQLVDVRDFRLEATDNTEKSALAKKWEKIVLKSDGFIIVCPEYNHSYPGELKMMLDMLWKQYNRKPVGVCTVSAGPWAGTRVKEHLLQLIVAFNMVPLNNTMMFPMVQDQFNEDGIIKDKEYDKRAAGFLEELMWYAKALKSNKK